MNGLPRMALAVVAAFALSGHKQAAAMNLTLAQAYEGATFFDNFVYNVRLLPSAGFRCFGIRSRRADTSRTCLNSSVVINRPVLLTIARKATSSALLHTCRLLRIELIIEPLPSGGDCLSIATSTGPQRHRASSHTSMELEMPSSRLTTPPPEWATRLLGGTASSSCRMPRTALALCM